MCPRAYMSRKNEENWILRSFADITCGMLRVCVVFHPPWFLETIHWLCLPILILVLPFQSLFTLIEDSDLEKIEICATIHTFFNKLEPIYNPL